MQPKKPPPRHDNSSRHGDDEPQHTHAAPRPEPPQEQSPPSRLLFVEVRGPRNRRQPGLLYDRSASELKSHVMLVHGREKRRAEEEEKENNSHGRRGDRMKSDRTKLVAGGRGRGELAAIVSSSERGLVVPIPAYARLAPEMGAQFDDPFDTLPVESTPEVHAAIRYYFENYPGPTPFTHDSLVYDQNAYRREKLEWSQVQFSFCQDQKISYLIMLFIWQMMKNLGNDMDYETSKYWAMVLRVTREEMPIDKTGEDISESYVAVIAGLGVAETWLGNYTNARQHNAAMLKLVAARGGFQTFGPMARRALKWCEFYPCACLALRPGLPRMPVQPLHPGVTKRTEAAHARTMALLPPSFAGTGLDTVLFRLHVCLGQWAPTTPQQPAFTGILDDLEHQILVELADRREKAAVPPAPAARPAELVYSALLQAAQMCVFGSMPFTRKEAPMFGAFAAALRRVLGGVPDVVGAWVMVASAESLLWVLFIGWATASQLNGDTPGAVGHATWFVRHFSAVVEALGVGDEEGVHEVMGRFPWDGDTYREPLNALWDIYRHRDELNIT